MSRSAKGEGTKIAQAAKDLNVTSVTIRRYISEFNIDTTSDENGIKVLPKNAMEELHEIRRLKDEGMTNPQVLETLEERRSKPEKKSKTEAKKTTAKRVESKPESKPEAPAKKETKTAAKPVRKVTRRSEPVEEAEEEVTEEVEQEVAPAAEAEKEEGSDAAGDGRSKHTLTCQTCNKTFEHMNPRLRDCLDCYRAKRKERRRGGDKHKNVIQHPLAQQVANKSQQQRAEADAEPVVAPTPMPAAVRTSLVSVAPTQRNQAVRNYRKAIEETRGITSNLKRRLERPDLPEGERRWLEQIYAYQLILHQGWRHLAEYKAGNQSSSSHKPQQSQQQQAPSPGEP